MSSAAPMWAPVIAFLLSVAATPLVRAFARRIGAVAQPKADRWHSKPTAMMGGVAIVIAVVSTLLLLLPRSKEIWVVIAASSALFVLGLIDDFLHLKPYQKLAGQLLGASAIVYIGLVLPWTSSSTINMAITFFWLVGVTNAVNMLDNMDGLAAGVSAIAAGFLGVNFLLNGQPAEAVLLGAFAAALAGFLVYNHNPASIFMGDCGSMFVGFFLASTALLSANSGGGRSRSVVAVLAIPVLVLCIPIFDTTFVTVMRKLAGRAASQGGRDHTSHRLVALGLSERTAVWMLYAFAVAAGVVAMAVRGLELDVSVAVIAAFAVVMGLLGVYLAGVRVYKEEELAAARRKPVVSFLVDLSYKRRVFEVALDVTLIMLSYYGAYVLVFGPASATSGDWQLFLSTLPVVVFAKLATFLGSGMYRGMWRYLGVADVMMFARSVGLSSVFAVTLIVFAFRFEGFSRAVFAVDGMLLMMTLVGSRFAFRILRRLIPESRTGKRVLIFGAGDGGELLWRELANNKELPFVPVGFVDDDVRKKGKRLHGLKVHSGDRPIPEICLAEGIDEVLLSTLRLPLQRLQSIITECAAAGIPVKRMRMDIQRVADEDLGWVLPNAEDDGGAIAAVAANAPALLHVNPAAPVAPARSATDH